MTVRERPGIYSQYAVNLPLQVGASPLCVGVAAAVNGANGTVTRVGSYNEALESFGVGAMSDLVRVLCLNGAGVIYACPAEDGDYASAFASLLHAGADVLVCDSEDALDDLFTALENTELAMGVIECSGTASEMAALAQSINSEKLVLCGNHGSTDAVLAAALAGVIAGKNTELLTMNGQTLLGVGELAYSFDEDDIEELLSTGVSCFEPDGELPCVIRGVTTRTMTNGASDRSFREIGTVLAANDVLKSVRDALRVKFAAGRNDELTRGAIRAQVVVELEKKLTEGRISHYANVSAVADADDPTLCRVGFEFTVVQGISTILLTACLEV